jgi:hypothetical protein
VLRLEEKVEEMEELKKLLGDTLRRKLIEIRQLKSQVRALRLEEKAGRNYSMEMEEI